MKTISALLVCLSVSVAVAQQSHPPLHEIPAPSDRMLEKTPTFFVDAAKGDDTNPGTDTKPWKTINHAFTQLKAGDTLAIRGGTYYENLYCAIAGRPEKPITIRAYPGERVIIDGGMREFFDEPANCWEPIENGEYRSTKTYRNIRDVLGMFGDSNIGLQTYWYRHDLNAENEFWILDKETKAVDPVYCGPGIFYDKQTGRIHCRLGHTNIDNELVPNYQGETDPRKLPLVIAPFASTPLFVDQAKHVRFQDLVIRGGGFNTIELNFGIDLEFENVTVFCATYGIRSRATGPLKMTNCGIHGGIPPWGFRSENSLHTHSHHHYAPFIPEVDTKGRNIARLPTHALVVTEGTYEFEVFAYPRNHDWDISHCDFTDGHDGVYLSGNTIHFHNNHVDNIQDDAIYLSSPSTYFSDDIHIYQNLITRSLMAFGCHSRGGPDGNIYIYRNIADLRQGVNISRPTPENPQGRIGTYHIYLTHGRKLLGMESLHFYQNTFVSPASPDAFAHRMVASTSPVSKRRVFNNLCVYLNRYGWLRKYKEVGNDVQIDGNLHWCSDPTVELPKKFLEGPRTSEFSEANKANYPTGWCANDIVADPKFMKFSSDPTMVNDYRLQKDSPAGGAGIILPEELTDPLRPTDNEKPEIGAIPFGGTAPTIGRK